MKLFNSLSHHIEELKPLKEGQVSMYTCGPTVYDHVHIGNLRSFIVADTLRRALAADGLSVQHTMNITDIDDKMIARSQETFPKLEPLDALKKLATRYSAAFFDDVAAVGVDLSGTTITHATAYIEPMQEMIRKLLEKDIAYVTQDGIFFSIAHYERGGFNYGRLINLQGRIGAESRIGRDEYDKNEAADFALWKKAKPDEPFWNFEVQGQSMPGRPGWFLECSVMSTATLGQPFDIHTGGVDLRFPHHENEIAQSTAAEGREFAQMFVHNEHLLVESQKMAKSAGNFLTLAQITERGFDPLSFRLLMLQSHYRHQINFTWESLEAAELFLMSLRALGQRLHQPQEAETDDQKIEEWQERMILPLFSDLDTPAMLATLADLQNRFADSPMSWDGLNQLQALLQKADSLLGLDLAEQEDISLDTKETIAERQRLRSKQKFEEADKLRAELEQQGIALNDTPAGVIWMRVKPRE